MRGLILFFHAFHPGTRSLVNSLTLFSLKKCEKKFSPLANVEKIKVSADSESPGLS